MRSWLTFIIAVILILLLYNCTSNKHNQNVATNASDNKQIADTSIVYTAVEQMPAFPGGYAAMHKYIADNLKCPSIETENGVQGRVTIRFTVLRNGKIRNIEALRDTNRPLADSLIKVISQMPDWTPGKQNGIPVNVYYTLPINIHLKK